MTVNKNCFACMAIVFLFASCMSADAATMSFETPAGANIDGMLVDAEADITTSSDTVDIEIRNLLEDPTSVKQVVTGLFFELSTGETVGTISSTTSPNPERSVNPDGTFIDGIAVNTGWALTAVGGNQLLVDILNFPGQPQYGVLGPPNSGTSKYDNSNGSINNSMSHNPFVNQVLNISLNVPGVTAESTISNVLFQFNTVGGDVVVPEPSSSFLALAGLVTLMLSRRKVV